MRLRFSMFALLALASASAAAGTVDINLSNDTVEANYVTNAGLAEWTFGGLYNRDTKDRDLNVGLLATGESSIAGSRIEGGLGGKLYSVVVGDSQLAALALGGQVRWFPGNGPFAIAGYGFYAPHVVTLIDGERFWDVGVRAEVEVIRNSFVYIGYRQVHAVFDNQTSANVAEGAFLGMEIKF
ncbi:MAG TPA: YfaZ family outer membrane protein [Burkholderiales bacterium]